MKFIQDQLPYVTIVTYDNTNPSFKIDSMQSFNETPEKVILKCAEYVDEFKRGFTCDMQLEFILGNWDNKENNEQCKEYIEDLVLVHINKCFELPRVPQYEYVFYK